MRAKILVSTIIIAGICISLFAVSCSKSSGSTKPKLSWKTSSASAYPAGSLVEMTLKLEDKEGDVGDQDEKDSTIIWVQKISKTGCSNFTAPYRMPVITPIPNLSAEVSVNFGYPNPIGPFPQLNTQCLTLRNDSSYFRFWMRDAAGNYSDTIESPVIVFLKQ